MLATFLIALTFVVAFLLVGIKLFGIEPYIVESASMQPALSTGGIAYVQPTSAESLQEGDIITFQLSEDTLVTHRIVAVISDGGTLQFQTQGDANDSPDASYVSANAIVGKVVFSLPALGVLAGFIQGTQGHFLLAAWAAFLLLMLVLPEALLSLRAPATALNTQENTHERSAHV